MLKNKNRRLKLSEPVRDKIALRILKTKETHQQIADMFGVSRQLVTLVAQEYKIPRTKPKGMEGSLTYPKRTVADIKRINSVFDLESRLTRIESELEDITAIMSL